MIINLMSIFVQTKSLNQNIPLFLITTSQPIKPYPANKNLR